MQIKVKAKVDLQMVSECALPVPGAERGKQTAEMLSMLELVI
jgi:hypothetical protein